VVQDVTCEVKQMQHKYECKILESIQYTVVCCLLQLDHPSFLTHSMRVLCRRFSTWRMTLVTSEPKLRILLLLRSHSLAVHCGMWNVCLRVLMFI